MPEYRLFASGKFEPHYVIAAKRRIESFMQRTWGERYKVRIDAKHGELNFYMPDGNHISAIRRELDGKSHKNRIRWKAKER